MDYQIVEYKIGDDTNTYFKPYKQNSYGMWEEFPEMRGRYCDTYEDAYYIITKNHVTKVKTYNINLQ